MENNKIQKNTKEKQKKSCKINNKQRGITLIALVVTIVVLLILAGVSISLILDNNGIISKSKDAKNKYAQSRTNEQEDLNDASAWIEQQVTGKVSKVVKSFKEPKTENSTIDGKEGNSSNPVIPAGYVPINTDTSNWGDGSSAPTQNDVDHGLVISDEKGNEWVWVPVPDVTVMCDTSNTIEYTVFDDGQGNTVTTKWYSKPIKLEVENSINPYADKENGAAPRGVPGEGDTNNYREPDMIGASDYYAEKMGFESAKDMVEAIVNDYNEMISSIDQYGGFYIGRYELSEDGTQKDKETLTESYWDNLYTKCKKPNASEKVETRMIWGCQWDMACNFIATRGDKKNIINSESWGNYENSIAPADTGNYGKDSYGNNAEKRNTGSNEAWKANNIYDLAGNCLERTQETVGGNQSVISRGGHCRDTASSVVGRGIGTGFGETTNGDIIRYSSNSNSKIIYTLIKNNKKK